MLSNVAMTGEITLTGKVLPIRGLKEKTLAAARHKKNIVIIPKENEKDLEDLPKIVKENIEFKLVKRAEEVFKIVFDNSIYAKDDFTETKIKKINDSTKLDNINYDSIVTQ